MFMRHPRWPRIDLYQPKGRSTIKSLTRENLYRLIGDATDRGWSANGRPDWLREHEDRFRSATLVVFGPEGASLWRCIVTVVLADDSGGRFTLDVSTSALDNLPDLDEKAVVILAHRYLATFPPIDLDPDQAASWEESVWKRWGES
jgi:hypothetical protein